MNRFYIFFPFRRVNDQIKLKFFPPLLFPHGKWFPISIRFERDYVIPPLPPLPPPPPPLLYFLLIGAISFSSSSSSSSFPSSSLRSIQQEGKDGGG